MSETTNTAPGEDPGRFDPKDLVINQRLVWDFDGARVPGVVWQNVPAERYLLLIGPNRVLHRVDYALIKFLGTVEDYWRAEYERERARLDFVWARCTVTHHSLDHGLVYIDHREELDRYRAQWEAEEAGADAEEHETTPEEFAAEQEEKRNG